jgi:hypothetical protein
MYKLVFLGVAFLLGACSTVDSSQPVGEKATDLTKTKAEWDGSWLDSDGDTLRLVVTDPPGGGITVGWLDEGEGKLKASQAEVRIRDAGDWTFVNFKEPDDTSWQFGRILKKSRQMVIFLPDVERFQALVKSGKLPGKVEEHSASLETLSPEQLALIQSDAGGMLWNWEDPLILFKAGD